MKTIEIKNMNLNINLRLSRENTKLLRRILSVATDFRKMSDDEIKFTGQLLKDIIAYLQRT